MSSEVNFDGIIGPTHNYGGLSFGNVASIDHKHISSHPKQAALQGLAKMRMLMQKGVLQAVLPPHERPFIPLLRRMGFRGSCEEVIAQTAHYVPELMIAASSASAMWAANAATVAPSSDTANNKVHFTPANMCTNLHRSIEALFTERLLRYIFADKRYFAHHPPLPSTPALSDEGAANHTRFSGGVHLFVYGQRPKKFPARQTLIASQAIARLHQLNHENVFFVPQNPDVIDDGVFHNDVISVGFENLFFVHEKAFVNTSMTLADLGEKIDNFCPIIVMNKDISVTKAVSTYLFNSQIVRTKENSLLLVAPQECLEDPTVAAYLKTPPSPIDEVLYCPLKQSMQNGGGPACLRLRVSLTEDEVNAIHPNILLTETLYQQLVDWVEKHYRETLTVTDLGDPQLLCESRTALDELTKILKLGSVYDFQAS